MIRCDKNALRGADVELSNENDPWGDKVSVVFARDFALEEALTFNENVPRGDNVVSCVKEERCETGIGWGLVLAGIEQGSFYAL